VCEQLLADALEDGGSDNITIIVGRQIPKELDGRAGNTTTV
jgi:serine/threonine protein phosphatase PrpC